MRESGHKRVPEPPDRIMGIKIYSPVVGYELVTFALAGTRVHYKYTRHSKTDAMPTDESRSEQVITAYKRHKLAISALHHVRRLLRGFEQERLADRRLALFGVFVILLVLVVAVWQWLGGERIFVS